MRKILTVAIVAAVLALSPVVALASCTTHTYLLNGRYVSCMTCCFGGNCTTTCN